MNLRTEWERTSGSVANGMHAFPGRQVNFAIAAAPGAYSAMHINAGGFGTVVEEHWGHKIWWILAPNNDLYPDIFGDRRKDPLRIELKYWKVHAVRLRAGDMM